MSYGLKYYTSYYRRSGNITTIEIHEKDYSGSATYLKSGVPPLKFHFETDPSSLYQSPTVGTGCELRLCLPSLSALDLFTEDPQKYMVLVYDGESSTGTLVWQGFLNSGVYSEDYSSPFDKPITLYANDGMSVLEKIAYVDEYGENYDDIQTVKEIMEIILGKLGLSFIRLNACYDISINEIGQNNIFLYLELPARNFYDENENPMSCREVLDSIFGSLGLTIRFFGEDIYVFDPIDLHDTSKSKCYRADIGYLGGFYGGTYELIGGYLDISDGDIGWGKTGSMLDVLPSVDEVVVHYDPYTYTGTRYDFNDKKNWALNPGYFVYYPSTPDYWMNSGWTTGLRFNYWTCETESGSNINGFGWEGIKDSKYGDAIYYIKLSDTEVIHIFNPPNTFVGQDEDLYLNISFEVYVNTKHLNNIYSTNPSTLINKVGIPILVKVGDMINQDGGYSWKSESAASKVYHEVVVLQEGVNISNYRDSVINDTWTKASISFPLGNVRADEILLHGRLEIRFLDEIRGYFENQILPTSNASAVFNILIRNVEVQIVYKDSLLQVENEGIETKARLSNNILGNNKVELKCLVGVGDNGCSRGALRTEQQVYQGDIIPGLYRDPPVSGEIYTAAEMLAQSTISQYKSPRLLLMGTLLFEGHAFSDLFKLIKDSSHLGSRAFFICSGEYDDMYETLSCKMVEIASEREEES